MFASISRWYIPIQESRFTQIPTSQTILKANDCSSLFVLRGRTVEKVTVWKIHTTWMKLCELVNALPSSWEWIMLMLSCLSIIIKTMLDLSWCFVCFFSHIWLMHVILNRKTDLAYSWRLLWCRLDGFHSTASYSATRKACLIGNVGWQCELRVAPKVIINILYSTYKRFLPFTVLSNWMLLNLIISLLTEWIGHVNPLVVHFSHGFPLLEVLARDKKKSTTLTLVWSISPTVWTEETSMCCKQFVPSQDMLQCFSSHMYSVSGASERQMQVNSI